MDREPLAGPGLDPVTQQHGWSDDHHAANPALLHRFFHLSFHPEIEVPGRRIRANRRDEQKLPCSRRGTEPGRFRGIVVVDFAKRFLRARRPYGRPEAAIDVIDGKAIRVPGKPVEFNGMHIQIRARRWQRTSCKYGDVPVPRIGQENMETVSTHETGCAQKESRSLCHRGSDFPMDFPSAPEFRQLADVRGKFRVASQNLVK